MEVTAYGNLAWRRQPGSLPSRTIPAVRRHSSALRRLVGRLQGGRDTMRRLLVMRAAVGQSGRQEQSQKGNGQAWRRRRFRGRQPRILSLATTLL